MLIICPSCISTYRLNAATQAARPATARCAQCRNVFVIDTVAAPTSETVALLPAHGRTGARDEPLRIAPEPMALTQGVRAVHPLRPAEAPMPRRTASPAWVLVLIGLMLGTSMAGMAFRERVAAAAPSLAPLLFAAPGPVLEDVKTVLAEEGTTKVLTLEGRIANTGPRDAAVPDLKIVVRDDGAQNLYTWTTPSPRATLASGETVAFRSRLVSPPGEGHDVVVSFAETFGDASAIRPKGQP